MNQSSVFLIFSSKGGLVRLSLKASSHKQKYLDGLVASAEETLRHPRMLTSSSSRLPHVLRGTTFLPGEILLWLLLATHVKVTHVSHHILKISASSLIVRVVLVLPLREVDLEPVLLAGVILVLLFKKYTS